MCEMVENEHKELQQLRELKRRILAVARDSKDSKRKPIEVVRVGSRIFLLRLKADALRMAKVEVARPTKPIDQLNFDGSHLTKLNWFDLQQR